MTRKEELHDKASKFIETQDRYPYRTAIDMLAGIFEQVEREVWRKVAEHCHCMHNDGYTLSDVLGCGNEGDVITGAGNDELRTIERWALEQQKELG